ncbi:putative glutamine amidotransferase [Agrobacterium rubi TR3 = NBRC 13261]|uniref:Putative glutamine amidotransferase n=1 Tax=Agrobacterium rubi TR3 = NBRC 13261 TaxID=1368415 RepID=A0A081CXD5_9HYPH|nr:glutamine amidotransferase [Agrobacterium rubi]MCL6654452.1 GMP synthase [Agrobacterium rubi]GAK71331.1 putative glutamine amidotransferase [Agrobacterium rubi TR3 = NBRC 13261]
MLFDPSCQRGSQDRILIVLHQERSTPGRVGQMLVEKGYRLDIRRPPLGDELPTTLSAHRGAVIFGGPMSANDPDAFIQTEIDWLKVPLTENKPFLGICLGAQMLSKHLGAKVVADSDGRVEIGWYPLHATEKGRLLLPRWPQMVYHFHREGFELPHGAELLATGDAYPNQAYRYGQNAWGLQFHAELTRAMMQSWVVRGAEKFGMPNAQVGSQHLEGRMLFDNALKAWLSQFLDLVFNGTLKKTDASSYAALPSA